MVALKQAQYGVVQIKHIGSAHVLRKKQVVPNNTCPASLAAPAQGRRVPVFLFLSPAGLPGLILARAAAVPYLWSRLRQALRTLRTLFRAGLRGGFLRSPMC